MLSVFPPFPAIHGGATFLSLKPWVLFDRLTSWVLAILGFVPGVFNEGTRRTNKTERAQTLREALTIYQHKGILH